MDDSDAPRLDPAAAGGQPPDPAAPPQPGREIPERSEAATVVATVVLVAVFGLAFFGSATSDIDKVSAPTVIRVQEQYLGMNELRDGGWAHLREAVFAPTRPLETALSAYEQALAAADTPPAQALSLAARRAVVLHALGRRDEARKALEHVALQTPDGQALALVVAYARLGAIVRPRPADRERWLRALTLPGLGSDDWTSTEIQAGLFERDGKPAEAAAVRATRLEAARSVARKGYSIAFAYLLVIVVPLGLLIAKRSRAAVRFPRLSEAPLPPRWSLQEGWEVLVRGMLISIVCGIPLYVLAKLAGADRNAVLWLAELPALLYLSRALLRPHGLGFSSAFGLKPAAGWPVVAGAGLALAGIEQLLTLVVGLGATVLGAPEEWSGRLTEPLISGHLGAVLLCLFRAVVLAPLIEEVTFRGVIYGSFRRRLSPLWAAVISSALFSLMHGYSPAGTTAIFVGAIAWALVYERTRSLWPCIIAHAINNLLASISDLLLR